MPGKNISKFKNTMAHTLNDGGFMEKISNMSHDDIESEFLDIIHNPDIVMAPSTRKKYDRDIHKQKTELAIKNYIYQLGFKSSGMGGFK